MTEVRVHELARELGVTSKQVLNALGELGEFVRTAASEVRPAMAHRVRQRFTSTAPPLGDPPLPAPRGASPAGAGPDEASQRIGFRPPRPAPLAGRRGVRPDDTDDAVRSGDAATDAALRKAEQLLGADPGSTPRPITGELARRDAERALGAEPGSIPRHRPTPKNHHTPRSNHGRRPQPSARTASPPRPGALTAEIAARWQLRPDAAREMSQRWTDAFLAADGELATLRAFWTAGFGRGQHTLVLRCLEEGIRPEDLSTRIDGRRIGEAILGGVPVRLLARRLRDG